MLPIDNIFNMGDFAVAQFELWALALVRISFMSFLLPIFGISEVPNQVKAGLAFFLSLIIFPTLAQHSLAVPDNLAGFSLLMFREVYIGIIMALGFTFVFSALSLAGKWIDQETGFSSAQLFNPMTEENDAAMGQFLYLIFGVLFLCTGMYSFYVKSIAESFHIIPLGEAQYNLNKVVPVVMAMTQHAFVIGVKLAAPVIVVLFLSTLALGIVARIMPQINVWLVGMPLKIGLGLGVVIITLPILWQVYVNEHENIVLYCAALLRSMRG